jgi:hypothetical protein
MTESSHIERMTKAQRIERAAVRYLAAQQAHRDALRLLEIGRSAASTEHRKILTQVVESKRSTLDDLIYVVAAKEALDLITFYATDPQGYPDGKTSERAWAVSLKAIKARYRKGKCALCKGPALGCIARHAEGRSCA